MNASLIRDPPAIYPAREHAQRDHERFLLDTYVERRAEDSQRVTLTARVRSWFVPTTQ